MQWLIQCSAAQGTLTTPQFRSRVLESWTLVFKKKSPYWLTKLTVVQCFKHHQRRNPAKHLTTSIIKSTLDTGSAISSTNKVFPFLLERKSAFLPPPPFFLPFPRVARDMQIARTIKNVSARICTSCTRVDYRPRHQCSKWVVRKSKCILSCKNTRKAKKKASFNLADWKYLQWMSCNCWRVSSPVRNKKHKRWEAVDLLSSAAFSYFREHREAHAKAAHKWGISLSLCALRSCFASVFL